jgi:hypothetical protein
MGPIIMGAGVTVPVVSEKRQKNSRLESGQIVPHRGDRVSSRAACCSGPGAQSRRRRATAPQLSYLGAPGRPLAVEFKLRRRARTLAQAQRTAEAPIQMRRRPRPRNAYGMS